jgi:DNA-binding transcriptional regulator YhcF (GntR family)
MRRHIEESLRKRRRDQGALPSVRELSMEFGASPQTVHKALRQLADEGVVHAVARKGHFWGAREHPSPLLSSETPEERFRRGFHSDLRQGAYHPWKELPGRTALAQVYGVGVRCAGRVLEDFAAQGILQRRGRAFFPAHAAAHRAASTSVLAVVRCDERGELELETEREIDFLKALRRELSERGLGLRVVGYCSRGGGRLLERDGTEFDPARWRVPLLGAIASTWLVPDPTGMLDRLARLRLPLSVWWEHAAADFPRRRFPAGLAGFNLSFGESAGVAVARHLAAAGCREVAYLSPFHNNDWSPARLRGLRAHLEACGGTVRDFVDLRWSSPWELLHRGGARRLDQVLRGFLDDPRLAEIPTWVLANDQAVVAMHRLLRDRTHLRPRLVGFDNTSDSERLGFESFELRSSPACRRWRTSR